jgi:hypothetical protein
MHGTDEVWVAGKEETAIAFGEFGHGKGVEVWFGLSLPKIRVLVAIAEPGLQFSRFHNKSPLIVCSLNSPAFRICFRKKIQMLQIGRRFDRVLGGNSQTFLSL